MSLQIEQGEKDEIDNDAEPLVSNDEHKVPLNKKEFATAAISSFASTHKPLLRSLGAALIVLLFLCTLLGRGGGDESYKLIANHIKLITVDELVQNLTAAKLELFDKLKADYGEDNFQNMFFEDGTSKGRTAFVSPTNGDVSWNRMKNKMALKLLRVLTGQKNVQFVWATGGHSAAASHGNFHNQSYTATMEQDLRDVFASIGMQFTGLNYAMGGTSSAPEIAFCVQSVFGTNFDVLSWDFGMTDGNKYGILQHYFYRALRESNRPVTVTFLRDRDSKRIETLADLENKGASTLYLDHTKESSVFEAVPDTFGMTQEQLDALPPMVRNFKCDKVIEEGEPFCAIDKFDASQCTGRKFRVSWHPGFKWHAANGHLMSLLLLELLADALQDIQSSDSSPAVLLTELRSQDDENYEKLMNSTFPSEAHWYGLNFTQDETFLELLFKKQTLCHTALLPAVIRYTGVLANSDPIDPFEFELIKPQLQSENVHTIPNDGDTIRLVAEMEERQYCPRPVNIDHKDYFYVHSSEGQKEIVLPNDAEVNTYSHVNSLQGYVAFCFTRCNWGDCPAGNILDDGIANKTASVTVNGEAVTSMASITYDQALSECYMLMSNQGLKFTPNEQGRFKIQIKVEEENHFMRIATFVLW